MKEHLIKCTDAYGEYFFNCEECLRKGFNFISLNHPPIKVVSTALLKCPAEETNSCGANNLSFKEFFLGSCCSNASKWTDTVNDSNEVIKIVENYYEETKEEFSKIFKIVTKKEENVLAAEEVLEHAQSHVLYCQKDLNDSINDVQRSKKALNEIRSTKKKAKERFDFLRRSVPVIKDEIDRSSCTICFKIYASDCQESAISCGHRFCLSCLMELEEKTCPTCQSAFTVEQIYKLI